MLRKIFAAAALAVLPLAATVTPAHALFSEPIPVGNWTLTASEATPAAAKAQITMNIKLSNGTLHVEGFAGCNTYSATGRRASEVMVRLSEFEMTRRTCEGDADTAENAFVAAFSGAMVGFDPATSTTTVLHSREHAWTFTRSAGTSAIPAANQGSWSMFNTNSAALRGAKVVFNVEADGSFTASAGCNTVFGVVRSDAAVMRVHVSGSTMMMCASPVMKSEQALINALTHVTHVETMGNRLYLKGAEAMSFTRQR